MAKDNHKTRWETFKFWDLVRLILEPWHHNVKQCIWCHIRQDPYATLALMRCWENRLAHCLLWQTISTTCITSMLRNGRKCKYIRMFPKIKSSRQPSNDIDSLNPALLTRSRLDILMIFALIAFCKGSPPMTGLLKRALMFSLIFV